MTNSEQFSEMVGSANGSTKPLANSLRIQNFAHISDVDIAFGDLTILVGPQGSGKSLALQWLKVALDGRQIVSALRDAGHQTEKPEVLIDLIFGTGMGSGWNELQTKITIDKSVINRVGIAKRGSKNGQLFFIPAHRAMLISDGWASPFQRLTPEVPVVARLFSQNLFETFNQKDAGTLFPVQKLLKRSIREKIDAAIFHGGQVGIEDDAQQHARRLRLIHGDIKLPFMTWTAGQREFTPLLLGLYNLLPRTRRTKDEGVSWVVIEEPEMGLHPQAITAFLLLVLELMARGYRVILSTHSPHVLAMSWLMRRLIYYDAPKSLLCKAFNIGPTTMGDVPSACLKKDYRAYMFDFDEDGRVTSHDITELDPDSSDERVAGWGGLTSYSSDFANAVREAANRSQR
jgi:energy-coupling factor transporter ATP-binding protein EcfA2